MNRLFAVVFSLMVFGWNPLQAETPDIPSDDPGDIIIIVGPPVEPEPDNQIPEVPPHVPTEFEVFEEEMNNCLESYGIDTDDENVDPEQYQAMHFICQQGLGDGPGDGPIIFINPNAGNAPPPLPEITL